MGDKLTELYRTSDEFTSLILSKKLEGYTLKAYRYLAGKLVSTQDWFFPNNNLPEDLLIFLCDADLTKPFLPYKYEQLVWNLTDLDNYEV